MTIVARLRLFVGKGGVGKTTISAAYAVHRAFQNSRERVLLLSTDPAHSLADIFQCSFHDKPDRIKLRKGELFAWQVNAEKEFRAFLNERKQELISILASGSIFSEDEIEPFLDATLPGMAEVSALLAIDEALGSEHYSEIVVDTAPFGHTLRLFQMPANFRRFLDFLKFAASRDQVLAAHFGGAAGLTGESLLGDWTARLENLLTVLRDEAELVLVTTPETFALQESLRCSRTMQKLSPPLQFQEIVLNRAVLNASACSRCRKQKSTTNASRRFLRQHFPDARIHVAEDYGAPIVGADGLRAFGAQIFGGKKTRWKAPLPPKASVQFIRTEWPLLETPLAMVLGKGGVGKTTLSAALGFQTRAKGKAAVEICSVDPAPSLDDIFQTKVEDKPNSVLGDPKFCASEMDSATRFQDWAAEMKNIIDSATSSDRSKIHVDLWFERQLFEQLIDSVPPGLDEVLAVFRILDLLNEKAKRLVIDMAPTGHALELLRTPERLLGWTRLLLKTLAAHRKLTFVQDAAVQLAELAHRVRDLGNKLGDSKISRVYVVMLAEPLPDRETERLMKDLESLKLAPHLLFINRVLFAEDVGKCLRCRQKRAWQTATIASLKKQHTDLPIYAARNFADEIAGKKGLQSFTSELWQVA